MRRWIPVLLLVGCPRPPPPPPLELPAPPARTAVVVLRDLPRGGVLVDGDLALGEVPVGLPASATLSGPKQWVGRTARAPLIAGEPLRQERLCDDVPGEGIEVLVPPATVGIDVTVPDARHLTAEGFVDLWRADGAVLQGPERVWVLAVREGTVTLALSVLQAEDVVSYPWHVLSMSPTEITRVETHGDPVPWNGPIGEGAWVAVRRLWAGLPIGSDDVVEVPATIGPSTDRVLGRVVAHDIFPGELIPEARLATVRSPAAVPRGHRGMALDVPVPSGVPLDTMAVTVNGTRLDGARVADVLGVRGVLIHVPTQAVGEVLKGPVQITAP